MKKIVNFVSIRLCVDGNKTYCYSNDFVINFINENVIINIKIIKRFILKQRNHAVEKNQNFNWKDCSKKDNLSE